MIYSPLERTQKRLYQGLRKALPDNISVYTCFPEVKDFPYVTIGDITQQYEKYKTNVISFHIMCHDLGETNKKVLQLADEIMSKIDMVFSEITSMPRYKVKKISVLHKHENMIISLIDVSLRLSIADYERE